MKKQLRLFYVFFLLCLLSTAFSTIVSAKELEYGSYKISATISDSAGFINKTVSFIPNNGTKEFDSGTVSVAPKDTNGYTFSGSWTVSNVYNSAIVEKGNETEVILENAYLSLLKHSPAFKYYRSPTFNILISYTNGQYETITDYEYNNVSGVAYIKFSFVPSANVKSIKYHYTINVPWENETTSNFDYYIGEFNGDTSYYITIDQVSREAGLLEKISGGISKLAEEFKNGLLDLGNKLSSLGDAIAGLPEKIGDYLSSKIQGLFVPSDENITSFKDRMLALMNDRLGAVYEVIDITMNSWDDVMNSSITREIEMPLVTIPLGEGNEFSFGGYTVKIVPDGFDFLAYAVQLITGILATIAFVGGMRKRYDEVMGVEQ